MTLSSSLGLPKKLIRIRDNPEVAIAYHAREHTPIDRGQYVLVQGLASFDPKPDRGWLESITPEWEEFLGPKQTGLLERWLDVYYWQRVAIRIEVRRVALVADADCAGEPDVFGEPVPARAAGPRASRARARPRGSRRPASAATPTGSRTRCWAGSAPTGSPRWSRSRSSAPTSEGVDLASAAAGADPARRPPCRAHLACVQAADGRPGAAGAHRLAHRRRRADPLRAAHPSRLRAAALEGALRRGSTIATRSGIRKARAAGLA